MKVVIPLSKKRATYLIKHLKKEHKKLAKNAKLVK